MHMPYAIMGAWVSLGYHKRKDGNDVKVTRSEQDGESITGPQPISMVLYSSSSLRLNELPALRPCWFDQNC